ncbi:aspartyl protease [Leptolyngbya sp. Heron Island J]|uniref:ATP-dependent zinc protease family protein n=1 Tax=Leptolyngbya sp. Heron Island J TaxID=1385935 RepID=UPI0003B93AE0|nr:RimK/LysX family protein [Leptolyngbya sp. Heron Island J]ESA38627.1 aspartyl protease [Leptolyngbya sp. Heron Island J]
MLNGYSAAASDLPLIGWREWIQLPDFGITSIKAKVDTGARSSSIHALNIELFDLEGMPMVRFQVAPAQHNDQHLVQVETKLLCQRTVRDSGGHQEKRPVVITTVSLGNLTWPIELTLTNRDVMGFRMLLGRQAIRDRFLVHSGYSFLQSRKGQSKAAGEKKL